MKHAICIGSYKAADFIELNILQCAAIFPGVPILISDDLSAQSEAIKEVSAKHGCAYVSTETRRGHVGGYLQGVVNGLAFAAQEGADVLVMLRQRAIPVFESFASSLLDPLKGDGYSVSTFDCPAECFAIKTVAITPDALLELYRQRLRFGRYHPESDIQQFMEELCFDMVDPIKHAAANRDGQLVSQKQSELKDYRSLASIHGLNGEYDCRTWPVIEGPDYVGKAESV